MATARNVIINMVYLYHAKPEQIANRAFETKLAKQWRKEVGKLLLKVKM